MASRNKRQAESPLLGVSKETRSSSDASTLASATAPSSSTDQQPTYSSILTGNSKSTKAMTSPDLDLSSVLGNPDTSGIPKPDLSIFKTNKPQGAFRDEIVVEVNTIDDEPYKGTVTVNEAVKTIFIGALGFGKESLGSITIGYSMGRIITFKLKDQFNIDQLASAEEFSFERTSTRRNGEVFQQKLGCKIRGIRKVRTNDQQVYGDDGSRWVKIEGCEYRIEKEELKEWMGHLGEVMSEITEDRVNLDSDSEGEDSATGYTIGNGIYSVKMKLTSDLPQFVPICGKRIRLYYRGIKKMCTNCFGAHARKVCTSTKVQWIQYVSDFMLSHDHIPMEHYGRWAAIVKDWNKNSGYTATPSTGMVSSFVRASSPTTVTGGQAELSDTLSGCAVSDSVVGTPTVMSEVVADSVKPRSEEEITEEVAIMLSRLRSLGMDVTPTVIAKEKDKNKATPRGSQLGANNRKSSLS